MQRGAGTAISYARRGWDFGVQDVLQNLFEDEDFWAACDSAHPPDAADPEDLGSGPYFRNLDRDTLHVWSKRARSADAGMYGLGRRHTVLLPLKPCTRSLLYLAIRTLVTSAVVGPP